MLHVARREKPRKRCSCTRPKCAFYCLADTSNAYCRDIAEQRSNSLSMQICSLACRILSLVGGTKVTERCWQTGAGTDGAIFYISKDWTGWLMRRFKGLKTCHWLSNEAETKYHNFINAFIERCKTKGKSDGCDW